MTVEYSKDLDITIDKNEHVVLVLLVDLSLFAHELDILVEERILALSIEMSIHILLLEQCLIVEETQFFLPKVWLVSIYCYLHRILGSSSQGRRTRWLLSYCPQMGYRSTCSLWCSSQSSWMGQALEDQREIQLSLFQFQRLVAFEFVSRITTSIGGMNSRRSTGRSRQSNDHLRGSVLLTATSWACSEAIEAWRLPGCRKFPNFSSAD